MAERTHNQIAVNLGSYARHREGAFAHLEGLGVRYVEIAVPALEQLDATRCSLADHGLSTLTLLCPCDLTQESEPMRERLEAGRMMGVDRFFISAKSGDLPKPEAYRRLRERAELAAEYCVTLCIETHPPLAENAGEARATMLAVEQPNLRWNLDTANLYYYNQNIDAVEQARRGLDLIASVHLKDTNGGFRCWWFPPLGEGVVDFPAVFRLLGDRGFRGPYTLELEGIQGRELDEAGARAQVERSLRYLQEIGAA